MILIGTILLIQAVIPYLIFFGLLIFGLGLLSGSVFSEQIYYYKHKQKFQKKIILPMLSLLAFFLIIIDEKLNFSNFLFEDTPFIVLFPVRKTLLVTLAFFFLLGVVSHIIVKSQKKKKIS